MEMGMGVRLGIRGEDRSRRALMGMRAVRGGRPLERDEDRHLEDSENDALQAERATRKSAGNRTAHQRISRSPVTCPLGAFRRERCLSALSARCQRRRAYRAIGPQMWSSFRRRRVFPYGLCACSSLCTLVLLPSCFRRCSCRRSDPNRAFCSLLDCSIAWISRGLIDPMWPRPGCIVATVQVVMGDGRRAATGQYEVIYPHTRRIAG